VTATAIVACAALAAAVLIRWEAGVVWAIAVAAGAYAAGLALGDGSLDPWAPLVAGGLVGAAELGQWAVELARPAAADAGIRPRRGATIAAVMGAGAGAGWLMLLVSNAASGGLVLTAAGLIATAAAMVLVSRLARSG
jgi:hypothetical protein